MMKKPALTPTLIVIVGFLTVCPVIMLVVGSFSQGLGTFEGFTVEKYVAAYTDPEFAEILLNTLIFTVGAAVLATVLALFLAYMNTRTNIPFKFVFRIISIIPMMIPHILFSVSWVLLLNPSNGILNRLVMEMTGLGRAPFNIYSLPGMILVEALLDLPIAYLIIAPAMSAFDVSLEESSKVCGASNLRTLVRVTLPVLRPAILASAILVVVRSLASFAVPSVIGMPGRIYVLATHIYRIISTGFAADYGKAAAVGMSALAASITLIYVYRYLTAESGKFVTISSRGFKPAVIDLKGSKYPLFTVVGLICFVLIVLPVLVLFYTSITPYVMVPGARALAMMSWKNWAAVLQDPISLLSLEKQPDIGARRGHGRHRALDLRGLCDRQDAHARGRHSGILELSVLLFSGDRHRGRVHVVFCPHAALRHPLGAFDRLRGHLPAVWHTAAVERLRADPQPPGGILARVRRGRILHPAPDRDPAADPGDRLGLDPDGNHVRARADPVGGALAARHGSAGGADPALCRRRPVGQAFGPGHHDDHDLIDPGRGGLADRQKVDEDGGCRQRLVPCHL